MDFWAWLEHVGLIEGDPTHYSSGKANPDEYRHALETAIAGLQTASDPTASKEFWRRLKAAGGIQGDDTYYSGGEANEAAIENAINVATKFFGGGGGDSTQGIPRNAKLVKIGNQYRVVWNLGDNLGWAWYDVTNDQLSKLFDTTTPTVHFELDNMGQFQARFGDNYWGNVGEINLKADTPWEDLKSKIFSQFGWVPGFDDPQIKRLMVQGFFEGWDQNQWLVEYRQTDYFKNSTDQQRKWVGYSDAEKAQQVQSTLVNMGNSYRNLWGDDPNLDDQAMRDAALKIASGQTTFDEWLWHQRQSAEKTEGTPAFQDAFNQDKQAKQAGIDIENLTMYAGDQWRTWMGPVDMPDQFATTWGKNLATGDASEADLMEYLKGLSTARWQFKPEHVSWQDWSSVYKSQIRNTLELGSLDDNDSLLQQILSTDLNGVDVNRMIRQDSRFRSTNQMYNELSQHAAELGKRFGFIT